MKVKLSLVERDFLLKQVLKKRLDIVKKILQGKEIFGKWQFEVTDNMLIDLDELCKDKMQEIGFDEDWNLTESGKILDRIISLIYFMLN